MHRVFDSLKALMHFLLFHLQNLPVKYRLSINLEVRSLYCAAVSAIFASYLAILYIWLEILGLFLTAYSKHRKN